MTQLYDRIGRGYGAYRRPDARVAAAIAAALGDAFTVVNVGRGPAPTSRLAAGSWPSSRRRP